LPRGGESATRFPVDTQQRLRLVHEQLAACKACPKMVGPVVHGPPVITPIFLLGQAPGPREGGLGRPFAWTAGRTLFSWLQRTVGLDEAAVRERVYFAAVARCFPGKAKGGGDRRPDPGEIERCRVHLQREIDVLQPTLIIPVGALAIGQVLGGNPKLVEVVGGARRASFLGVSADVVCLPHPSGASTWHRSEPGKALLERALGVLGARPEWRG
jgi:uracil-DNA glycosylase